MTVTRRRFLQTSGTAVAGAAAAGTAMRPGEADASHVDFSTIEAGLEYEIEHGRVNEIIITETSPTLPPFAPAETQVDWGNVVIKFNLKIVRSDNRYANDLNLWLFKPKSSVVDPTTIYDPPSYVGHGPKGHYTLRYPSGNNTFVRKEDTPLWNDYIDPNWELVPGAHFVWENYVTAAERDNIEWPGPRAVSAFHFDDSLFPVEVPLRVAKEGIHVDGELFLTLLEIRRFGRLRLMARTMIIKPVIGSGICVAATVASGASMAGTRQALRELRDEKLTRTAAGRRLVDLYYRSSPLLVRLVKRFPRVEPLVRFVLLRIGKILGAKLER